MDWPIIISQDKVALDVMWFHSMVVDSEMKQVIITSLGFSPPETGPWLDFYWRWGNSKDSSPHHNRSHKE